MAQDNGSLRSKITEASDQLETGNVNYLKEAFQWQYNWIGLGGAAAFALVSGTALPIILAAGVELMYLAVVPQSSAFRRLVRSWKYADQKKEHEKRLRVLQSQLPPELREKYTRLQATAAEIRGNYARLSSTSQIFVEQMNEKLNALLSSYLRLGTARLMYGEHLWQSKPDQVAREADQLKKELPKQPAKVQEVNKKRIEILQKRIERFQKTADDLQVLNAQCEAIEDVLDLIRDQSVTLTDPEQVSGRLESLIQDVEETESTVREIESFFQMPESGTTIPIDPLPSAPPSGGSNKVVNKNRYAP